MKKHLSPKAFFILASISIAISIYQFITATFSVGLTSIFYALVLSTAGVNRLIVKNNNIEDGTKFPKYFLGSIYFIGLFTGMTLVYIIFLEVFGIPPGLPAE